jgi:hypothetical protein
MVGACCSSGPIITVAAAAFGLVMWRCRKHLPRVILAGVLTLVGLEMVMKAHVWYLLGRFDLAGGSTGWWRAELITQAGLHIKEWWLMGTDYTHDWMPVAMDENNVDITNEYIEMGVWGGLPLMLCFIYTIRATFSANRRLFRSFEEASDDQFFVWMMGTTVFGHVVTFISVSYFDQTIMFWCLIIAMIASLERHYANPLHARPQAVLESTPDPENVLADAGRPGSPLPSLPA